VQSCLSTSCLEETPQCEFSANISVEGPSHEYPPENIPCGVDPSDTEQIEHSQYELDLNTTPDSANQSVLSMISPTKERPEGKENNSTYANIANEMKTVIDKLKLENINVGCKDCDQTLVATWPELHELIRIGDLTRINDSLKGSAVHPQCVIFKVHIKIRNPYFIPFYPVITV